MSTLAACIIRPLTSADEPFLWDMLYLAIYVPEGNSAPSRDILTQPEIAKYAHSWGRTGDYGLIAVERQTMRPIGAAWLRLFTESDRSYGYVAADIPELTMAILPEFRGKGVGTRLLGDLIAEADLIGFGVSLSVDPANPAFVLYKRSGFQTVGINGTSLTMLRLASGPTASNG